MLTREKMLHTPSCDRFHQTTTDREMAVHRLCKHRHTTFCFEFYKIQLIYAMKFNLLQDKDKKKIKIDRKNLLPHMFLFNDRYL